jgi:LuxR family transcriptional regulator, maltose regulon positive regulatory protein
LPQPAPSLLQRHAQDCAKHAPLIAEIFRLLPGEHTVPRQRGGPGGRGGMGGEQPPIRGGIPGGRPPGAAERGGIPGGRPPGAADPITQSESRVLRYLPTNLSAPEIARELSVSVSTIRTHIRHLFAKLGVHRRTEAVAQARALGLLTPTAPVEPAGRGPG